MTISETGKIQWAVPDPVGQNAEDVVVRIGDASGQERMHSFRVEVEE
jgi:hypothetical protein